MTPFQQKYAPQLRDLLIGRARYESKITYGEAAEILGIHHRTMGPLLGAVGRKCQQLGEPILTALVVNASSHECGEGLLNEFGVQDPVAERQRCTDWWGMREDEQTDDIDRRAVQFAVTERRPEQHAFRRKVFTRYLGRCPVTDCELEGLLDAAHLPGRNWRDGHNQGEDGVLLRADIHRLLDSKLLQLHKSGTVLILPEAFNEYGQYSDVSWLPPTN
jgi:hypothetical protein